MKIHIYHHLVQDDCIEAKLDLIMSALTDLQDKQVELVAKVAELQVAIDAHQAQDAATIAALNEQIAALQAVIASGATAEQLASVTAGLTAVRDSVVAAQVDISS
jgi:uncharacterized coiled-coil protein SlyX